jgi:hypothetical protein
MHAEALACMQRKWARRNGGRGKEKGARRGRTKESAQPRGHKRAGGGAGAWGRGAQACMLARWHVSAWKESGHGATEREEGGGRKECIHAVVAGDAGACVDCRQPDCLNPFTGMIAARPGCLALTKLRRQFGKAEGWREGRRGERGMAE